LNNSQQIRNAKLHFILSKERTGSSMLATMLNQLDDVLSPSEEPFLLYFHSKYKNTKIWTRAIKKQFLDDFILMHERNIDLYFYDYDTALKNLYDYDENLSYLDFCKAFYFQFLKGKEKKQVSTIIDKQLKYPFYIDEIKKITPDSKFIFLVRDPRDNVITCQNRKLGRHLNTAYQASYWNNYFDNATVERLKNENKFLLVKYENIVEEPKKYLTQICEFLGVQYNDKMLSFHDSFSSFIQSNKMGVDEQFMHQLKDFHSGLQRPLDNSKIGIWKKENPEKIALIEATTHTLAKRIGYDIHKPTYQLTLKDRFWILLGTLQKKWVLKLYYKIPFSIKIFIKKVKKPYRKA